MPNPQDESKANQDALSGKLGTEKTSDGKPATTSKKGQEKKFSLTAEEHRQLISNAKAEEGRKWKPIEVERDQLKTELGNLSVRMSEMEETSRARAYEEARSDPTSLTNYNKEQEIAKRERDAATREANITRAEAQHKADKELWEADTGSAIVSIVAAKYGLEVTELEDLGVTDRDTLDKIATRIKAGKPADTTPETEEAKEARVAKEKEDGTYTPASEVSSAAKVVGEITVEKVEETPMEQLEQQIAPPIK